MDRICSALKCNLKLNWHLWKTLLRFCKWLKWVHVSGVDKSIVYLLNLAYSAVSADKLNLGGSIILLLAAIALWLNCKYIVTGLLGIYQDQ